MFLKFFLQRGDMLEPITESNCAVFERLAQDYEEEFAPITGKTKQPNGKYSIDVDWHFPNCGYFWKEDSSIVGFVIKDQCGEYSDIGEFYIIPSYRKMGMGKKMAFSIFDHYPGLWQVRQIENADLAKSFWRNVVSDYTKDDYFELELEDLVWGKVTCQRFKSQNQLIEE